MSDGEASSWLVSSQPFPTNIRFNRELNKLSFGRPNLIVVGLEHALPRLFRELRLSGVLLGDHSGLKSYDGLLRHPSVNSRDVTVDVAYVNDRYAHDLYSWRGSLERLFSGYYTVLGVFDCPVDRGKATIIDSTILPIKMNGLVQAKFRDVQYS